MLFLRRVWFIFITIPLILIEFMLFTLLVVINEMPISEFYEYGKEKWPKGE